MAERTVGLDVLVSVQGARTLGDLADRLRRVEDAARGTIGTSGGQGLSGGTGLAGLAGKAGVVGVALAGLTMGMTEVAGGFVSVSSSAAALDAQLINAHTAFGQYYSEMDRWAQENAGAMGMTRTEAMGLTASSAMMFRQMRLGERRTIAATQQLARMSGALSFASGGAVSAADASDMLQSAFRGEYDSLQRLIPNISDARVQSVALQIAHKQGKKAADAQTRALAVLGIVQRDGASYLDQYGRSQDSALVKTNKAKAAMREQWQELQMQLLPAFVEVWGVVQTNVVPALQDMLETIGSPQGQQAISNMVQGFTDISTSTHNAAVGFVELAQSAASSVAAAVSQIPGIDQIRQALVGMGEAAAWAFQYTAPGSVMKAYKYVEQTGAAAQAGGGGTPTFFSSPDTSRAPSKGYVPAAPKFTMPKVGGIDWDSTTLPGSGSGGSSQPREDKDMARLTSRVSRVLDQVESRYQRHRDRLDDLRQSYADLKTSITEVFRGASVAERGGQYSDIMASYRSSRSSASAMLAALRKLKRAGLSNGLLQQLAAAGPAALQQATSILGSGRGGIAALNAQARDLTTLSRQAGGFAADAQYGRAITIATRETSALRREMRYLRGTVARLEKALAKGVDITPSQARRREKRIRRRARAAGQN